MALVFVNIPIPLWWVFIVFVSFALITGLVLLFLPEYVHLPAPGIVKRISGVVILLLLRLMFYAISVHEVILYSLIMTLLAAVLAMVAATLVRHRRARIARQ